MRARPSSGMLTLLPLAAAAALACTACTAAGADTDRGSRVEQRRLALRIGNGAIRNAPLRNPVNDARDMAAALARPDFERIHQEDTGHGIQGNGRQHLMPVDAKVESEPDVRYEAVGTGRVRAKREDAGNDVNIGTPDACRDSPSARSHTGKGEPGEGYTSPFGMKFVWVPAGTFWMGSAESEKWRDPDEVRHQVTITKPYYLQTTEVTQGQWAKVMGTNPSGFGGCGDACPVQMVSWLDAAGFCNTLSEKEGLRPAYRVIGERVTWDRESDGYRLPTEAEWEYACRAGTQTAFHTGEITYKKCKADPALDRAGWFCWNSPWSAHPVGQKEANAWGLHDMHGNVWEWCWDRYGEYPSGVATDPVGPSSGSYRVYRGGSWSYYARSCRSANRNRYSPPIRGSNLGFRLCRSGGHASSATP